MDQPEALIISQTTLNFHEIFKALLVPKLFQSQSVTPVPDTVVRFFIFWHQFEACLGHEISKLLVQLLNLVSWVYDNVHSFDTIHVSRGGCLL